VSAVDTASTSNPSSSETIFFDRRPRFLLFLPESQRTIKSSIACDDVTAAASLIALMVSVLRPTRIKGNIANTTVMIDAGRDAQSLSNPPCDLALWVVHLSKSEIKQQPDEIGACAPFHPRLNLLCIRRVATPEP
jgi:hypothetical protein